MDPSKPTAEVRSVLVVDDDQDCADTIAMTLRRLGAKVHVAYSGASALDLLKAVSPDLILLDLGMPGMDGCEVAKQIRKLHGDGKPVLVALTGWGRAEDRQRTVDAGFDHHIVKPTSITALTNLLKFSH